MHRIVLQVYIEDSDDEDALRLQPSICSLPDWTQDNKPTPATIVASDDGTHLLQALTWHILVCNIHHLPRVAAVANRTCDMHVCWHDHGTCCHICYIYMR